MSDMDIYGDITKEPPSDRRTSPDSAFACGSNGFHDGFAPARAVLTLWMNL